MSRPAAIGRTPQWSETHMDTGHHLILFDGVCGLCTRLTRFVLPRDPGGIFHFASLQSPYGRAVLQQYGKNPDDLDTLVVVRDYATADARFLTKSQAALTVLETIGGIWRSVAVFRILPVSWLDRIYDVIARYRYRVFGKHEICFMPSPEERSRFLGL
ncbi:MAG: DUF393 domain-containing protein [Candidatus Sericytochromatia bacterium]|nr:DUF393 domain-containing protein [Candidatus Sericytochromatia bacterium]